MIQVQSFSSHQAGKDGADVCGVIAATTQQANAMLAAWKHSSMAVNILSSSSQLAFEGSNAAYVLTLVVDLRPTGEEQDEIVTDEDLDVR